MLWQECINYSLFRHICDVTTGLCETDENASAQWTYHVFLYRGALNVRADWASAPSLQGLALFPSRTTDKAIASLNSSLVQPSIEWAFAIPTCSSSTRVKLQQRPTPPGTSNHVILWRTRRGDGV